MNIPTWHEAKEAVEEGTPTLLETFVYSWEPVQNCDAAEFRIMLLAVLNHKTKYNETYQLDDPIKVEGTQEEFTLENTAV